MDDVVSRPNEPTVDTTEDDLADLEGHSFGDDEEDPDVAITATGGICVDGYC